MSADKKSGETHEAAVPLVVDVDGTLVKTDLLHEAMLRFVAKHPLRIWRLGAWLARGKAAYKAELAARVDLGLDSVPMRDETVAAIREAQAKGRPVYLASASDRRWVEPIADRIGGIAGVMATDGTTNLAGDAKAAALIGAFGKGGFDYIGDARVDLPVWAAARRKLVVAHSVSFGAEVMRTFPDAEVIARPRATVRAQIRSLRPHQWVKNLLVFLPVIAGHSFFDPHAIFGALGAFAAFCLAASSAYLINDLLDLPNDRDHPRKRSRPFAAGEVGITRGIVTAALLMAAAALTAAILPPRFAFILAAYVVVTLAYSLYLKRKLLLDVIVLGGLYTIRVFGGVAATGERQSQWLLMFSLFLFLSLATVKRCSELIARRELGKSSPPGRGYAIDDLGILLPLAAAAGYGATLVVMLYLSSPEVVALYHHPMRLWLLCPLIIYWISRVLVLTNRGQMHDDPIIFAFTDRVSWLAALAGATIIAVSI